MKFSRGGYRQSPGKKRPNRAGTAQNFGANNRVASWRREKERPARGNMLVFITACTVGLLAALAFFGLGYVRLLGSNNEQKTAIEAAALAAARDLSLIAVNTNAANVNNGSYGWISLSDYAPSKSSTIAGDNWDTPVRSINTILGTIRLDMIIADQIGDANLKTIIKADLAKAQTAQQILNTALQNAIQPGQVSHDINGNPINVYLDAENAYKANQIRMTGSSNYVTGSLKLSLGCLQNGAATNIPIPSCGQATAKIPDGAIQNNNYVSYVDAPLFGSSFIFAGIGTNVTLVDPKNWVTTPPGAGPSTQYLASIIKAEADQHMNSAQDANGYTIHAVACAQPANVADPRPAPGALSFSFPDGIPPEITKPGDMLTDSGNRVFNDNSSQAATSFSYSSGGDFPYTSGSTIADYASFPYSGLTQNTGNVFRQALYDWWKRAGTKLNVASAVSMMTSSTNTFTQPNPNMVTWRTHAIVGSPIIYTLTTYPPQGIPIGSIHIYKVSPATGQVTYQTTIVSPIKYAVAGENQLYSENIGAIFSSSVSAFKVSWTPPTPGAAPQVYKFLNTYDCYIRDQVYRPAAGAHSGEPMDYPLVAQAEQGKAGNKTIPCTSGQGLELGSPNIGCDGDPPPVPDPVPDPGKGKHNGLPPAIVKQSDFAEGTYPLTPAYYYIYSTGPGTVRPTYQTNGMATEVRFRRQVAPVSGVAAGFQTGYVGEKLDATPPLP
ncbi:MAG: hypothetical protein KGS72_06455 [Cyanobacteria bacterium REEB67]|nr:hypothetical protein [Cyanobacteria bacterium REEB67]